MRRFLPWMAAAVLLVPVLPPGPRAAAASRTESRGSRRAADQLNRLGVFFEMLQADPASRIPPALLREARGLLVLRETRAGLILGGRDGEGVALVRTPHGWSAPAFIRTREGGVGFQAGWQSATFVHLLMTESAVAALRTNRFRFGVGLRITSGPRSLGDEAKTLSSGSDVLVYSETSGLFGGLSLEGGTLGPAENLNRDFHGRTLEAVLFDPEPASAPKEAARAFVNLVERYSRDESRPGG